MPVDTQLSVSNWPLADTRTPRTGTPSASPSRNTSLRTQSATATWSTAAPLGAARTRAPRSVQTCGTTQPSVASVRKVPDVTATGKSEELVSAIDGLPAAGLLADLPREIEPLEGELDGPGALAVVPRVEAVADLVVQIG